MQILREILDYEIIYSNNKHSYAKIKDGKLQISIPKILKYDKKLEKKLIEIGQQMIKKHKKYQHISKENQSEVLLFGEMVSKGEFGKNLDKELKDILLDYIRPIVDQYSQILGYDYKQISIKKVKSKWGSCSHDQKLVFSQNLVHLPSKYIKYVAIHEVCHLKHKNHSKKFWDEVEKLLPNYKEIRKEMKKIVLK